MLTTRLARVITATLLAATTLAQHSISTDPEPQWWKGNLHTHTFWSDGNPITATRRYTTDIGRVLAEVQSTTATYQCTGDELYIRAVIESDAAPDRPTRESLTKHAWSQPIQPQSPAE